MFQFHEVQLKAPWILDYYKTTLFQFHEVQLKVQSVNDIPYKSTSFNSMKYN